MSYRYQRERHKPLPAPVATAMESAREGDTLRHGHRTWKVVRCPGSSHINMLNNCRMCGPTWGLYAYETSPRRGDHVPLGPMSSLPAMNYRAGKKLAPPTET